MINTKIARGCYEAHENYWEELRPELRQLRAAYMTRYWSKNDHPGQVLIETSRAYEFVEGYVASLFARAPAVGPANGPSADRNFGFDMANTIIGTIAN